MNIVMVLQAARELLLKPENWIQGVYARDKAGNIISCRADGAVCFCAEGALFRVLSSHPGEPAYGVYDILRSAVGQHIPSWNDTPTRTHAEILEGFDKAIAKAKGNQ